MGICSSKEVRIKVPRASKNRRKFKQKNKTIFYNEAETKEDISNSGHWTENGKVVCSPVREDKEETIYTSDQEYNSHKTVYPEEKYKCLEQTQRKIEESDIILQYNKTSNSCINQCSEDEIHSNYHTKQLIDDSNWDYEHGYSTNCTNKNKSANFSKAGKMKISESGFVDLCTTSDGIIEKPTTREEERSVLNQQIETISSGIGSHVKCISSLCDPKNNTETLSEINSEMQSACYFKSDAGNNGASLENNKKMSFLSDILDQCKHVNNKNSNNIEYFGEESCMNQSSSHESQNSPFTTQFVDSNCDYMHDNVHVSKHNFDDDVSSDCSDDYCRTAVRYLFEDDTYSGVSDCKTLKTNIDEYREVVFQDYLDDELIYPLCYMESGLTIPIPARGNTPNLVSSIDKNVVNDSIHSTLKGRNNKTSKASLRPICSYSSVSNFSSDLPSVIFDRTDYSPVYENLKMTGSFKLTETPKGNSYYKSLFPGNLKLTEAPIASENYDTPQQNSFTYNNAVGQLHPQSSISSSQYYQQFVKLKRSEAPQSIQTWLQRFSEKRILATLNMTDNGGYYKIEHSDIHVFVPENALIKNSSLMIVRSSNPMDFPSLSDRNNLLSDVYHFLPHCRRFRKRILITFPISCKNEDYKPILLHSNTDHNTSPCWKKVSSSDKDAPIWYIQQGYCYLWLKHFCLYTLVNNDYEKYNTYKPTLVSLYGLYNPQSYILQMALTYQYDIDRPTLPKLHLGRLLDQQSVMLPGSVVCKAYKKHDWKTVVQTGEYQDLTVLSQHIICLWSKIQLKLPSNIDLADVIHMKVELYNVEYPSSIAVLEDASIPLSELCEMVKVQAKSQYITASKTDHVPASKDAQTISKDNDQNSTQENRHHPPVMGEELYLAQNGNNFLPDNEVSQSRSVTSRARIDPNQISIDSIIPHIAREFYPSNETDIPNNVTNHLIQLLDVQRRPNWVDLCDIIGNKSMFNTISSLEDNSPTEYLIRTWQVQIAMDDKSWLQLSDILDRIGIPAAAEVINAWRADVDQRQSLEGTSEDGDTPFKNVVFCDNDINIENYISNNSSESNMDNDDQTEIKCYTRAIQN